MQAAEKLAGGIDAFTDLVGRATSWLALGIALVMGANVLLRYAFSIGFIWAQELEWHIFVPICLFGMSYALLHGEHVRVDVLYARFTERNKLRVDLLSAGLCIVISAVIIWLTLKYVQQSYVIGEQSADPGGLPYRWLLKSLIPVGFLLLLLQALSELIKDFAELRGLRSGHAA